MNILDFLRLKIKFGKRDVLHLFFAFIFAIGISVISVALWLSVDEYVPDFINKILSYDPVLVSGFLFLIFVGYVIGLKLSDINLDSLLFRVKYQQYFPKKIDDNKIVTLFDFQGFVSSKYKEDDYLYINTSSEGLITKKVFGNLIFNFTAKIALHGFGVILCAKDLENYFMFRINVDESGLHISPHIRKDGIWEIQNLKLELENKVRINLGQDYNFQISRNGRFVKIIISDSASSELIKDLIYILPSRFPLLPSSNKDETPKNIVSQLRFPKYGKIGFRAWGPDEQAIIKDLRIKKYED